MKTLTFSRSLTAIGAAGKLVLAASLLGMVGVGLSACHGNSGSNPTDPVKPGSFSIGGTITGLTGTGLTLQLNGANDLTPTGNSFTFGATLQSQASYAVTVSKQPSGQTCTAANASGVVLDAAVANVTVTCSANTYTIGGAVSGLVGGQSVTLQNNGSNATPISQNGTFNFTTPVAGNSAYKVTVSSQPQNQTCTVARGTGAGVVANISNVAVTCAADTYTIGGTVTGLTAGQQVVLENNGQDSTVINANADGSAVAFTFATPIAFGSSYTVTTGNITTGVTCSVANYTGSQVAANVNSVNVQCSPGPITVSGTVSGLASGEQITITNSAANPVTLTADGTFSYVVPNGGSYDIQVGTQPLTQECTVANSSGSNVTGLPANLPSVSCVAATVTTVYQFSTNPNNDGLQPKQGFIQGTDGLLYGTTYSSIKDNNLYDGAFYSFDPVKNQVNVIYTFGAQPGDLIDPVDKVFQARDGKIYGTATSGGSNGTGGIFSYDPNQPTNGIVTYSYPITIYAGFMSSSALVQGVYPDNNLYSVSAYGSSFTNGTLYQFNPTTGAYTILYSSFSPVSPAPFYPVGNLIIGPDSNANGVTTFYGVTAEGGDYGQGCIYQFKYNSTNPSASQFTPLVSFGNSSYGWSNVEVNVNGSLLLVSNSAGHVIYGTTAGNNSTVPGTIFSYNIDTNTFATEYTFNGSVTAPVVGTTPLSGLTLGNDGLLYGTTTAGGDANPPEGTLYQFNPITKSLFYLHSFNGLSGDGQSPSGDLLIGNDGRIYGTTPFGGINNGMGGLGTIFRY